MKIRLRFALAALLLVLAACQGRASVRGTGEGKVISIDPARAEITIEHGDIEGVMKAMTMPFTRGWPSTQARASELISTPRARASSASRPSCPSTMRSWLRC